MYIKLKELCEKLAVHPNTVYNLIKEGLPHVKAGGYRFEFDKVEEWLKGKNK